MKTKKIISLSLATGLSLAAGASIVGISTTSMLNNNTSISQPNPNDNIVNPWEDKTPTGVAKDETTGLAINAKGSMFSLRKVTELESRTTFNKMYVLSINQTFEKGTIFLYDQEGNEYEKDMPVNPGEEIIVRVKLEEQYKDTHTLTNLTVYSANRNYYLNTWQKGDDYGFTLPEEKIKSPSGEMINNPFYNETKTITVEPEFNVAKQEDWVYDFNSKAYKIKITEEYFNEHKDPKLASEGRDGIFIADSNLYSDEEKKTSPNLDLKFLGEYETNADGTIATNKYGKKIVKENTKYVIDMNGYDLYFSHYSVPSGVNLIFDNSATDQFTLVGKESRLYGSKKYSSVSIDSHGVLTYWHGIKRMWWGEKTEGASKDRNYGWSEACYDHSVPTEKNDF